MQARHTPLTALTLLLALVLAHGAVRADAATPAARAADAYNRGDYAAAAELFAPAHERAPAPALLFNLAQAPRRSGACVESRRRFAEYVRTAPAGPGTEVAAEHLAEPCPPAAPSNDPRIDEPPDPTASSAARVDVAPVAAPPRPPLRIAGASAAAGGLLALAAGGAVFAAGETVTACVDKCDRALGDREFETRRTTGTASTILMVGGGALLATGIGLYVWGHLTREAPPLEIAPVAGGAVLGTTWRF